MPQPGPDVFIFYGRNDVWALGMVLHELLSSQEHTPFEQMGQPETYSDAGFRPVDREELPPSLLEAIAGLLRLDPADRMAAAPAALLLEAVDAEVAARVELERLAAGETQRIDHLRLQQGQRVAKAEAAITARTAERLAADEALQHAEEVYGTADAVRRVARAEFESAEVSAAGAHTRMEEARQAARSAAAAVQAAPQLVLAAQTGDAELAAALAITYSFPSEAVLDAPADRAAVLPQDVPAVLGQLGFTVPAEADEDTISAAEGGLLAHPMGEVNRNAIANANAIVLMVLVVCGALLWLVSFNDVFPDVFDILLGCTVGLSSAVAVVLTVAWFDASANMIITAIAAVFATVTFCGMGTWVTVISACPLNQGVGSGCWQWLFWSCVIATIALPPMVMLCFCGSGCPLNAATATAARASTTVAEQASAQHDEESTGTQHFGLQGNTGRQSINEPLRPNAVFSDPPSHGCRCCPLLDAFVWFVVFDGVAWVVVFTWTLDADAAWTLATATWMVASIGAWSTLVLSFGMLLSCEDCTQRHRSVGLAASRFCKPPAAMATVCAVIAAVVLSAYESGSGSAALAAVLTLVAIVLVAAIKTAGDRQQFLVTDVQDSQLPHDAGPHAQLDQPTHTDTLGEGRQLFLQFDTDVEESQLPHDSGLDRAQLDARRNQPTHTDTLAEGRQLFLLFDIDGDGLLCALPTLYLPTL